MPGDYLYGSGLARAVRAYVSDEFAALYLEGYAVQRFNRAAPTADDATQRAQQSWRAFGDLKTLSEVLDDYLGAYLTPPRFGLSLVERSSAPTIPSSII